MTRRDRRQTADHRSNPGAAPADRPTARALVGAVVIPVLATIAALAIVWSWRANLPDPVASHWGVGGQPDGFSSLSTVLILLAVVGVATIGACVWGVFSSSSAIARSIAGIASGTGVFVLVLLVGSLAPQRGVADAATVDLPGIVFVWSILGGAIAAAVTVLLIPRWQSAVHPVGLADIEPARLGPTERVVWTRVATTAPAGVATAAGATALVLILVVILQQWWLLLIAGLLALLMVALLTVRVTVDPDGLRVAGPLGRPRRTIPVADISAVSTGEVNALRDFGGWGYRVGARGSYKGAKGFVLRSGTAIVVTRRTGGVELVVVDDAHSGAALLEAYRLRAVGQERDDG